MSIIKGYVVNKTNNLRVPFCSMNLFEKGESVPLEKSNTDENGEFEFSVPAGSYRLMFAGPMFEPMRVDVEIDEDVEQRFAIETQSIALGIF